MSALKSRCLKAGYTWNHHLPHELQSTLKTDRLGKFSLEKTRLSGDLTAAFQYLKGYRDAGKGLFIRNCSDRTRGNGLKRGNFAQMSGGNSSL